MKDFMISTYVKMQGMVKNERGSQALEWIGVAAVIITIVTLLSSAVSSQGSGISGMVQSIFTKISDMLQG
ncbi:hypothetical protein [Falsibacillus pallidus]|uniref:hypothetical protein n=1 Tax=Falsibacillus pallidus TaxID=493781 RepID=UPI003D9890C0